MKTVWKYPITFQNYIEIDMPKDAKALCVQVQKGVPCIWVLLNPENELETRWFRLAGTGHFIEEDGLKYIGTFQLYEGARVHHLFEMGK